MEYARVGVRLMGKSRGCPANGTREGEMAEGRTNIRKIGGVGGVCVVAVSMSMVPAEPSIARPAAGPNGTVVHSALGGEILGYDVDRNGTVGILAEYVSLGDGKNNVALETFDQQTGNTIKVVREIDDTYNDFVAYPVVGKGVG